MDYQALPPVDIAIIGDPDASCALLLEALPQKRAPAAPKRSGRAGGGQPPTGAKEIGMPRSRRGVAEVRAGATCAYPPAARLARRALHVPPSARLPRRRRRRRRRCRARDGGRRGAGAAGNGRLPVAVLGDGDYLMGVTALWTAAPTGSVAGRSSPTTARTSTTSAPGAHGDGARPPVASWIGQRIAIRRRSRRLARGQGCIGIGPVHDPAELPGGSPRPWRPWRAAPASSSMSA